MALEPARLPAFETWCQWCIWEKESRPLTTCTKRDTFPERSYRRIKQIEQAAREGCWTCGLLLSAVERLWVPDDPEVKTNPGDLYLRYDAERFTINCQTKHPPLQIYCAEDQPQAYRFIGGPELPLRASSEETRRFIASCVAECLQNHPLCRKASQGLAEAWPSRILEIDPPNSRVKLVEFDVTMDQQYVALSYCWGPVEPPFQASSDTLRALKMGVSFSKLPKTLVDAVRFTVKLGLNLIWIDSLCIIQNNPKDWEEESCKMSTVYRHAMFTIIANCASSCVEGFLDRERDAPVLLEKVDVGGRRTEIRARKVSKLGHHRPPRYDHGGQHRCLEPVDTRGWTLQEKLLSPRSVTFTSDEVQWECRSMKRCECNQPPSEDMAELFSSPVEEWFAILEDYTSRRITKNTDRLVALSGISRVMSRSLRANYGAGIWFASEPSMLTVIGLLWGKMDGITRPSFAPQEYLAPSFSWASIVGEVIHINAAKFLSYSYLAKTLEVNAMPVTPDPFGSVAFGALKLEGRLVRTKMSWKKGEPRWKVPPTAGLTLPQATCNIDVPLQRVPLPECGFTIQRRVSENLEESERTMETLEFRETDVFVLPLLVRLENDSERICDYGLRAYELCSLLASS
ncbi:hypothetical protein DL764_002015 [Monosporascus ibericus]|uniref:Heterokaryon incompatibility domain-containing protein n=1 Tax=Monosporascus ibericus TaxID=155417 RepID=A0A4Q4TM88_9PEZI|nr:hypothetical protein DL764_002015 [Monosporascus ibericus]